MSASGLQRALAPASVAVFVVSGCGGSHAHRTSTSASAAISVDASGRIGPLRVDISDRRAVVAFAGHPDAERHGRNTLASPEGSARYDALGYDCATRVDASSYAIPLVDGGPHCRTVFFIRRGRLGLFYTSQTRYVDSHGVHVGTATAAAERLLLQPAIVGCIAAIELTRGGTAPVLRSVFEGGKIIHSQPLHLRGGHVAALILHSAKHDPGVFECE